MEMARSVSGHRESMTKGMGLESGAKGNRPLYLHAQPKTKLTPPRQPSDCPHQQHQRRLRVRGRYNSQAMMNRGFVSDYFKILTKFDQSIQNRCREGHNDPFVGYQACQSCLKLHCFYRCRPAIDSGRTRPIARLPSGDPIRLQLVAGISDTVRIRIVWYTPTCIPVYCTKTDTRSVSPSASLLVVALSALYHVTRLEGSSLVDRRRLVSAASAGQRCSRRRRSSSRCASWAAAASPRV